MAANYGGGNLFKNQRKLAVIAISLSQKRDANDRAPDLTGDIEITRELARDLVKAFKSGKTTPSFRKQSDGEQVVKIEIAANIREGKSGQYISAWLSEKWVPPAEREENESTEIEEEDIPF